jgi:hypothetical protein
VALRAVRALLAAHLQATFNRSRKDLGRQGLAAVIALVVVSALSLLPAVPMAAVGGYFVARALPQRWAIYVLGGALGMVPFMVGLTGAVFGGSRRLAWESYRVFPVRVGQLFGAELVAGFGDVWSLIYLVCGAAFSAGLCARRPLLAPLFLLLFVMSLAWMAATELVVGSLGAALVKRLRWLLVAMGLLFWMASLLGPGLAGRMTRRTLDHKVSAERARAVLESLASFWEWIPATHSALGLAAAVRGDLWSAVSHQAYPLGFTVLLLGGAYLLLSRETEPRRQAERVEPGRASRLWTFRSPAAGVGRLHWDLLIRSHLGRFLFLFPLFTVVLLKGPSARIGLSAWAVPAAFAYLSLSGANLQFNQFGLDGPGVKGLLLLPITGRDLLLGKLWGLAAHQGIQIMALLVLLGLLMRPPAAVLAAGAICGASLFVLQTGLGHWISIWQPRRVPLDKIRGTNLPFVAAMLQLGVTALGMGVLGSAWALVTWLAPAWQVPVQLTALAVLVVVYRVALPHAARYLERHGERLAERLG